LGVVSSDPIRKPSDLTPTYPTDELAPSHKHCGLQALRYQQEGGMIYTSPFKMAAMAFILSKEMLVSQALRSHSRRELAVAPLYY